VDQHPFVSDNLGLPTFPLGTEEQSVLGEHIMGVVVIGWLTHVPIAEWGVQWTERGAIEARFRSHLTAGLPLSIGVERDGDALAVAVTGGDGTVYATAAASCPPPVDDPPTFGDGAQAGAPLEPSPDGLDGQLLAPLSFGFDADRDLAFTARLPDGELWRQRRIAHPAWVAAGTNALIRRNLDFPPPGTWTHAGLAFRQHRPIEDGATVVLAGCVEAIFERPPHRFATAAITARVGDDVVATVRNTFVYARVPA
jgi:hypothetical protein